MRTNVDIDETLMKRAMAVSDLKTKKAIINAALREFIRANAYDLIMKYQGEIAWEGDLDEMRQMREFE